MHIEVEEVQPMIFILFLSEASLYQFVDEVLSGSAMLQCNSCGESDSSQSMSAK